MDRLEKALKKARELRNAVQEPIVATAPTTAVEAALAKAPTPASPPAPAQTQTRQVAIDEKTLEQNRVVARLKRSADADIFRILRTKVLQSLSDSNLHTIAVTSPNYGDGKTTVAVNLALSLALDLKQTVLLVDLDLRSPDVHNMLGLQPSVGLSDYLQHDAPVSNCMVKPAFDRLVVLPISQELEDSSEMLASPKMAALAHELKTRYPDRIVIYDMPPILTQDDTIAFLPHVEGVLLVVRDGKTKSDDLTQCMNSLGNANLIGTVLNNSSERLSWRS